MDDLIPVERIENRIFLIRGQKVMLDKDLAELYGVPTKVLNQAVKRNIERFPEDFMFSLSREEILRMSQFVTSSSETKISNIKYSKNVNAFTENGVAMLSSVLHSKRAIEVNIQIMRIFTKLRQIISTHKDLAYKLEQLEQRVKNHDVEIQAIFDVLRRLMAPEEKPIKKIGFV